MDKIGEVIGPKGKVINAIQQETGAEVIVDDDGVMGSVSIAGTDRDAVYEAQRQINLILDPPTADVGGFTMEKLSILQISGLSLTFCLEEMACSIFQK